MTKKETLKWRLSKLPTSDEVLALIKDGVITKDEGKEILFTTEREEERDEASLKAEIKFLRELVENLASKQTDRIIETIKYVEKPYNRYDWCKPYLVWCSSNNAVITTASSADTVYLSDNASATIADNTVNCAFTKIKTF